MNILHIDASASDPTSSHSRRLSIELVSQLAGREPGANLVYRDLAVDRLPHVDTTIRQAWTPEGSADPKLSILAGRSRELVEELKSADVIVIGSPMYNFSVPSTLKAWIDHVAIAGQTFNYTPQGPRGLLHSRAYLVLSSGGVYSQGPSADKDHLASYLKTVLGFLGIVDVEVIWAEGTARGPEQEASAMANAKRAITALA